MINSIVKDIIFSAITIIFYLLIYLTFRYLYLKKQKREKPDVGKIYKTTDGLFTSNQQIQKPRRVVVVDQRTDDKALAISKIYSKRGRSGRAYINNLILHPEDHPSLTEDSIVGTRIYVSRKENGEYKPFYSRELENLPDNVTAKEFKKIKKNAKTRTHRKTLKKWQRHFRD